MRRLPLWLLLLPISVRSQSTTSWGAEAEFNSRYLWRGIPYSKGPVFQPALWVTRGHTTVSIWSNMVLNNEPCRGRFDQLFFTVSRELQLGRWLFEPTLQGYTWQGLQDESNAKTVELSAKLSHRLGPVRLVTSHTIDIASFRGSFIADVGLVWKRPVHRWQVESSATTAWANHSFNSIYIGADRAALNYVQFTLSAERKSSHGWYIRPHADFVIILDSSIRRALDARTPAVAGLAVGREF
jgi:hypothetical protein